LRYITSYGCIPLAGGQVWRTGMDIAVIRPSGLPWMPAAVGAIDYGFRRWRADMAVGDTGRSADWYTEHFRTLI
ncbi:hypothetical protein KI387_008039, partial [Taxus chinensis]